MANSRVARGRKTQSVLAQWFRAHGYPNAKATEAFLPGADITGIDQYAIEVKATSKGDLLAALRQAKTNAIECQTPVVIWRPNGYGETRIGEWVVAMTLRDFTTLIERTK
jgi:predicted RecB family endonuclease